MAHVRSEMACSNAIGSRARVRGDHRACAIGGVATIGRVKLNDQEQIDVAAAAPGRAGDPITLEIARGALRATQSEWKR